MTTIPLFVQKEALERLRPELDNAIRGVLDRGAYVLGSELRSFEEEFADYLGVKHVLGVGNGTDAITLALRSLGIGPGDDVVVPSFTFWASAEAIVPTGARPVFCDVDLATYCVTAETVRAAITPQTKAIVAVDLFGNAIPADELAELGLPIVEDAAQAAGTTYGNRRAGALGTIATFSFYPSKNLGCFGDGGAVATDDDELAHQLRLLRSHGSATKVDYELIGFNSRLDELQAAVLRVFLRHLDELVELRKAAAESYAAAGLGSLVELPQAVDGAVPAWHLYVIRHELIDAVAEALQDAGIGYKAYYRTPVHRQKPMAGYPHAEDLSATEEAARTHLAIPMGPGVGAEEAERVVAALAALPALSRA